MIHLVYGDLSGNDEKGILTAGCFLGMEGQWMDAIAAWSRVLDDAGVEEFHATDFFAAQGEFDDDKWRRLVPGRGMVVGGDLHNEFAERFTAVADNAGLIGFAYEMDVDAFRALMAPELAKEQRKHKSSHPRTFATMSALVAVNDFLTKTAYREKNSIQVVFEHEHGAGRFIDFFDESKLRKEKWTWWFKSFTTAPKSFVRYNSLTC